MIYVLSLIFFNTLHEPYFLLHSFPEVPIVGDYVPNLNDFRSMMTLNVCNEYIFIHLLNYFEYMIYKTSFTCILSIVYHACERS
jgi:hypothetical protein